MQTESNPLLQRLRPLDYHAAMVAYLKSHESKLWDFHANLRHKQEQLDAIRLDLLKSTVRLSREAQPQLHAAFDDAARALDLNVPVSFYQSQSGNAAHINASVCCLPGECHVILSGPVLTMLDELELRALAGHELSHYRFLESNDGEMGIADRVLGAIVSDPRHEPSHIISAQRFRQYTEIYADRGSFLATRDLHAVIRCLVKVETALETVDAAAYLQQADEIFAKSDATTQGITHPESFIRARALAQWTAASAEDGDSDVRRMIEGPLQLDRLDLLSQTQLTEITRRFIARLLEPNWFRGATVMAQARLCFSDFVMPSGPQSAAVDVLVELQPLHPSLRDYFCYLMLDFAAVDPMLDDLPLLRGFEVAESLHCRERLEEIAAKELKLTKKALAKLRADGPDLLERARHANAEGVAPQPGASGAEKGGAG